MFVIQLKNKLNKILGTKYSNAKNWKRSEINFQNCGDSKTRITLEGSHNSEAAIVQLTLSADEHWPKNERPPTHNEQRLNIQSGLYNSQGSRKNVTSKNKESSCRYKLLIDISH